ncbi:MFS transporter [Bordetella genomosp. 11]|uniref:MFS transporter n=1 Tax=Bordetella genomosp. 11 TaxID=1416808 RepID=A0A261UM08_9BORD|nr:MFS transporter [Bordetella genomosp. 11]OZI62310.1 MFS transporter [Bordetella genomosp. 11]
MFLSFAVKKAYPFGAGMPANQRWAATLGLLLGVCMASLDTAIANTALPAIARDLQTTEARSIWVISSYQLSMVAALLPAATLGEIVGHRRIMVFGLVLFTLASLACGMAPDLEWLVAGRVVQGLGAAATMAVNGAMLRFIYPEKLLGRGVGLNSVMVALAFAAGPTAASLVLTVATWHWLFLINVPVGMIAIYFSLRALPVTTRTRRPFDTLGAVLCAGFLALLVFSLNEGAQLAAARTIVITSVLCVVCLLLLLKRQAGHPAPFLAVDLLRRPVFALSAATGVCSFATQSLAFVSLPFMLQNVLGYTQVETGFLITPWPVLVAVMAPIAGRLSDRMHVGILAGIGMAMLAVGMVLLATMPAEPSVFALCWRLAVCGAGFGFFQSPNVRALITAAPPERAGGASGMVGTVRLLGQSSGAALVAACFHVSTERGAILALWLGAVFAAAAAVASVMRLKYRQRPAAAKG